MHQRVRDLRAALLALTPQVLVLPHSRADIDALSSAHGVAYFLNHHGIAARVCAPSVSAPAARLAERLGFVHDSSCDPAGKDIVVVDTSSRSMLDVDVSSARSVLSVDHHEGGDLPGFIFDAPATAAVVHELVAGIADCKLLSFLAAGIVADTAGLYVAGADALSTLSSIFSRCSLRVSDVLDLMDSEPPLYERIARLRALERMRVYAVGEYVLVTSRVSSFEGSSAWLLVQAGADLAFVGSKDRISARLSPRFLRRTGITLQAIFSRLAADVGGTWGGHAAAAGMHTEDVDVALRAIPTIVSLLLKQRGFPHSIRAY